MNWISNSLLSIFSCNLLIKLGSLNNPLISLLFFMFFIFEIDLFSSIVKSTLESVNNCVNFWLPIFSVLSVTKYKSFLLVNLCNSQIIAFFKFFWLSFDCNICIISLISISLIYNYKLYNYIILYYFILI